MEATRSAQVGPALALAQTVQMVQEWDLFGRPFEPLDPNRFRMDEHPVPRDVSFDKGDGVVKVVSTDPPWDITALWVTFEAGQPLKSPDFDPAGYETCSFSVLDNEQSGHYRALPANARIMARAIVGGDNQDQNRKADLATWKVFINDDRGAILVTEAQVPEDGTVVAYLISPDLDEGRRRQRLHRTLLSRQMAEVVTDLQQAIRN